MAPPMSHRDRVLLTSFIQQSNRQLDLSVYLEVFSRLMLMKAELPHKPTDCIRKEGKKSKLNNIFIFPLYLNMVQKLLGQFSP